MLGTVQWCTNFLEDRVCIVVASPAKTTLTNQPKTMYFNHGTLTTLPNIAVSQIGLTGPYIGPMKGGLSVGCRLKIFRNVRCQLGKESVECQADWSVECWASNSECRCRPTLILV